MTKQKIDLAKEAKTAATEDEVEGLVTEEALLDLCPAPMRAFFKKAKTPAARADFYYVFENTILKKSRDQYKADDTFATALEKWFIQELPETEATGVAGKVGRVEVKRKEIAAVKDWTKFYAAVKRRGDFDLLNKAVNQKAVRERWEAGKEVPGVERFVKKVISLTGVKK